MALGRPDTQVEYFRKRGIKTKSDAKESVSFIGQNAATPFSAMSARMAARFVGEDTEVAILGEAYTSAVYERDSTTQHRTYEDVYGSTDFTRPVEQNESTRRVLDEVFGNNDNDPSGEAGGLSESGVKTSISPSGTTKNALRNIIEIHRGLYEAQLGITGIRDEESVGVRGVEEIGSEIEPIA